MFILRGKAPHSVLFPLCDLVVAHGGVGTVTTVARSGTPHVIIEFGVHDQPYWWRQRQRLGISPPGLCLTATEVTVEELAERIKAHLDSTVLRARCADFAERFGAAADALNASKSGPLRCLELVEQHVLRGV